MKQFIFLSAFFLFVFSSTAQKRVEIETSNGSGYTVVPCTDQGLVFFYESNEKGERRERLWDFRKLGTSFKQEWKKEVPIPKNFEYVNYKLVDNNLYLLFKDDGPKTSYKALNFDIKTGAFVDHNGEAPMKLEFVDFEVLNATVFIGGNKKASNAGQCCRSSCIPIFFCLAPFGVSPVPSHGVFVHHDLKTNASKVIAPNVRGNSSVLDVNTNASGDTYSVVLKDFEKNVSKLTLRNFGTDGFGKGSIELKSGGEHGLLQGKMAYATGSDQFVIGTYSQIQQSRISFRQKAQFATGIFFTKVVDGKQKFIKYHNFADFNNFFSYLGDRAQNKVERRVSRRERKGKETTFSYRLLVHDLIAQDDELIMVAEAYYPEYHTEYYYTTDANGRMVQQTRQVFDGWRYTHAIVAGLSYDGKLLWNNTFPIWDILTFDLRERVKAVPSDDKVTLVYSHGGVIQSKVIKGSKVLDGEDSKEIPTFGDDKVKSNWNSDIVHWYKNRFLSFGYQKIKSKDENGRSKRNVFYFTEVEY